MHSSSPSRYYGVLKSYLREAGVSTLTSYKGRFTLKLMKLELQGPFLA